MKLFEALGLITQQPFEKHAQPKTLEVEDGRYHALGEKPKWSRPNHVIQRNLEVQHNRKK